MCPMQWNYDMHIRGCYNPSGTWKRSAERLRDACRSSKLRVKRRSVTIPKNGGLTVWATVKFGTVNAWTRKYHSSKEERSKVGERAHHFVMWYGLSRYQESPTASSEPGDITSTYSVSFWHAWGWSHHRPYPGTTKSVFTHASKGNGLEADGFDYHSHSWYQWYSIHHDNIFRVSGFLKMTFKNAQ